MDCHNLNLFHGDKMNNLNKLKLATLSIAILAAASGTANAVTASSSLTIQTAFSVSKTADLAFGTIFLPGTGGGTLTIGTDGSASVTGTGMIAPTAGTTAASFDVSGPASTPYAITLPASASLGDGTTTLTVDTFVDSESGAGTLDGSGADSFTVGAKVTIPDTASTGSYTGTFDVTVDY